MTGAAHDGASPRRTTASHRRPGRSRLSVPADTFRDEVWANPGQLLLVAVGGLLCMGWGGATAWDEGPAWQRGLGVVVAASGALVWVSYALRRHPSWSTGERWTRTRPRRVLRAVLVHAWPAFLVASVGAALVGRVAG